MHWWNTAANADRDAAGPAERAGSALRFLVGLASAVVIAVGCTRYAGIIAPTVLALVVTICVQPARRSLERLGLTRSFASAVVIVVILLVIVGFSWGLVVSASQFAAVFPEYERQIETAGRQLEHTLQDLGVGQQQVQQLLTHLDPKAIIGAVNGFVGSVFGLGFGLLLVLALVLFMTIDAGYVRLISTRLRPERPELVAALEGFSSGVRRYMVVTAVLGAAVAVLDGVALAILQVPGAALWGFLAFVTGFIPNIGYWIGLAPPVVLALLEHGWVSAVLVIVVYAVINGVIQSGLQPLVVGTAVALNQTLAFLSVVVWTAILGPLGAILAIPLTLLVRALLIDIDPGSRWLRPMLGDVAGLAKADHDERRARKQTRKQTRAQTQKGSA